MANNNPDRYTPAKTIELAFETTSVVPAEFLSEDDVSNPVSSRILRETFKISECESVYAAVIDAMEDVMRDGRSVQTLVLGAEEFVKILAVATKDTYHPPSASPNMVDIVKEYIGVYTDCEIVVVPGSQISPVGRAVDTVHSHVEENR